MIRRAQGVFIALTVLALKSPGGMSVASGQLRPPPHAAATADTSPLFRRVTLQATSIRLGDALASISRQADIGLIYANDIMPAERRITVQLLGVTVEEAFRRVLMGTDVEFFATVTGQVVFIRKGPPPAARM